MSLGRRDARRHDTTGIWASGSNVGTESSYQIGERVSTVDGFPGEIIRVVPGPVNGTESYHVLLDGNLGGGEYTPSQIKPLTAQRSASLQESDSLGTAVVDYPELGDILVTKPNPAKNIKMGSSDPRRQKNSVFDYVDKNLHPNLYAARQNLQIHNPDHIHEFVSYNADPTLKKGYYEALEMKRTHNQVEDITSQHMQTLNHGEESFKDSFEQGLNLFKDAHEEETGQRLSEEDLQKHRNVLNTISEHLAGEISEDEVEKRANQEDHRLGLVDGPSARLMINEVHPTVAAAIAGVKQSRKRVVDHALDSLEEHARKSAPITKPFFDHMDKKKEEEVSQGFSDLKMSPEQENFLKSNPTGPTGIESVGSLIRRISSIIALAESRSEQLQQDPNQINKQQRPRAGAVCAHCKYWSANAVAGSICPLCGSTMQDDTDQAEKDNVSKQVHDPSDFTDADDQDNDELNDSLDFSNPSDSSDSDSDSGDSGGDSSKTASLHNSLEYYTSSVNSPFGEVLVQVDTVNPGATRAHDKNENPASAGFASAPDSPGWGDSSKVVSDAEGVGSVYGSRYDEFLFEADLDSEATLREEPEAALPRTDGSEGTLHEEPEAALPSTDGNYVTRHTEPELAVLPQKRTDGKDVGRLMAGSNSTEEEDGKFSAISPDYESLQSQGSVDDIVAQFQATASHLDGGNAGPAVGDSDIAKAAKQYLEKTSMKVFSPAEQAAIINEGEKVRTANFDRLDIVGTHYVEVEATLKQEDESDTLWF